MKHILKIIIIFLIIVLAMITYFICNKYYINQDNINIKDNINVNNSNNVSITDIDTLNNRLFARWKQEGKLTGEERFIQLKNNKVLQIKSIQQKIDFLITDLTREERKLYMYSHSLPEMTANKVARIESGKLLLEIVTNNPELSQEIGDNLKEVIMSRSHDTVRGIALYYLSEVEKISGLSWNIGDLFPKVLEKPDKMNYFDYYLNKSYNNN